MPALLVALALLVVVAAAVALRPRTSRSRTVGGGLVWPPSEPLGPAPSEGCQTTTPEEDEAIARDALAKGEVKHAAFHIAGALAGDCDDPARNELLEKIVANADDPLALAPLAESGQTYYGIAAVRAYVLERSGGLGPALRLILAVVASRADAPFLSWAERWSEKPGAREALAGDLGSLAVLVRSDPAQALLERIERVIARLARPGTADAATRCMALTRLGRLDDLLAEAEAWSRACPGDAIAASFVGNARRARGEIEEALAAYRESIRRAPAEATARLEMADMLLNERRDREAAESYAAVLDREPAHPWALPSLRAIQASGGSAAARRELERLAAAGNERAQGLLATLDAAPYVDFLPARGDATVNLLAQGEGGKAAAPVSIRLSGPEAPSVCLAVEALCAHLSVAVPSIEVEPTPEPDPRRSREGAASLWRWEGWRAHPAAPPPPPEVRDAVRGLVERPFQLTRWWDLAAKPASALGPEAAASLLAAMLHPPPVPPRVAARPWGHIFLWQVATAFVLARLDPPGPEARGFRALASLVRAPADWTGEAAIIALAAAAIADTALAPAVLALYEEHLRATPREGYSCTLPAIQALASRLRVPDARWKAFLALWRKHAAGGG